jgi:DNA repair exonuclease SbcCD ATPase subunit
VSDDYGYQVRRLETRTGGVEHELHSLRSKLGEVEDLDYELRDIRGGLRSLEDDLSTVRNDLTELDDDVRGHIQDTDQSLKRLTGRVQALEAHLLAAGGAPLADLDTIDPAWKKLARTANHGWHVRSGLLPRHQREAHRLKVREYEGAITERDEHRDKVVEAAGILASQPRTSLEFKQAVMDFGMSHTLAASHDQRARQLADPARAAQAALAQDDTLRQAKASLIEQGDKAERKLNWLLRGRLADAIRDRALLPMWFVTVLGPVPPAHKTQEWMDLATQVLAYRVTYGITDQVVALGPAPDEYVPRRTEWHRELTKDLRRW